MRKWVCRWLMVMWLGGLAPCQDALCALAPPLQGELLIVASSTEASPSGQSSGQQAGQSFRQQAGQQAGKLDGQQAGQQGGRPVVRTGKPPSATPRSNAQALEQSMPSQIWFGQEVKRKPQGQVWDKGVSGQSLARKRTPPAPQAQAATQGMNTQQAISTTLEDISAYERKGATAPPQYKGLKPDMHIESRGWRNPVTEPVRVDQENPLAKRNVVGAYADVQAGDDLKVRLGPELSLEGEKSGKYQQSEGSGLGLGMKFEWGF